MYDVDVKRIDRIFSFTKRLLQDGNDLYEQIKQTNTPSSIQLLAAQRVLLIYFEVFTDVTNLLIDGFVMRDPGGYEDMIDILDDEEVITVETSHVLRTVVQFYRQTVKDYIDFDLDRTASLYLELYPKLGAFIQEVEEYLLKELKPTREL